MDIPKSETLPLSSAAITRPGVEPRPLAGLREALSGWRWAVAPASIALVSRLFSSLLLTAFGAARNPIPNLGLDRSPFVAWDAQWYTHIAQFWYHAYPIQFSAGRGYHDFAFYPHWPLLIRAGSLGGLLPTYGTAVILANLVFVAAAIVIFRFFEDRFEPRVAL